MQKQLSQEFKYPNINQQKCSNIENEHNEKSLKITQNTPNPNYCNCKSEINVEKPNSQLIPENLNTIENNYKLQAGNDNPPITTQRNIHNIYSSNNWKIYRHWCKWLSQKVKYLQNQKSTNH